MSNIVIKPGHDPIPATVDAEESLSSSDPDMASLAQDLFYINVEKDPYDPTHKEVITIPVSVRSSLDEGTYLKHRRTLGLDGTPTDKGLTAKAMIVIGPAFKDAGLAFAGPVSSGAETYLGFDIKKHVYELKGRDNPHGGTQPGFTLDSSVYKITGDVITWKTDEATGTIRKNDVGQVAYEALKHYLTTKGADKKPVTIRDTTAFFGFARESFYWLIAAQTQAYQKLHSEKRITTIPPITLGDMLYVDSGKDSYGLLCLDNSKGEIIFPPPEDWETNENIELISLRDFETVDKATAGITEVNLLSEALMPWLAKENDEGAMVALIRFQFLSGAQSVDIENQAVTFASEGAAYGFVNTLFGVDRRKDLPSAAEVAAVQTPQDMAHLAGAKTYTTPGGDGLQFWFFEGAKATTDMRSGKGTDDNAIWSIAAFDDVRYAMDNPEESWNNYTAAIPEIGVVPLAGDCRYDAIILPILTDVDTGVTDAYLDASLFTKEGIKGVADNFKLPPGKRLPTEAELKKYYETPLHRYTVPSKPGFSIPITNEFGYPVGSITVVSDQSMVRIGTTSSGNPMPVAFVHAFYQPATQFQLIGGNSPADQQPHAGWTDLPGWYSYEQAYLMQQMLNLANKEGGYESTIRRIEEDGFRYENPDNENGFFQDVAQVFDYLPNGIGVPFMDPTDWSRNEPTDGKVKVARYAIQFDLTMFETQAAKMDALIAAAEAAGLDHIESGCGGEMSLDDAKEYSWALWMASKGSWEGLKEQVKKNPWGAAGLGTTFVMVIAISWVGIKALWKKIDRRVRGTLPAGLTRANQDRIRSVDPASYQGQNRVRRQIYAYLERKARGERCKSLLLVGPPGAGKTALIRAVLSEFIRNEPELARQLAIMFGKPSELARELGLVGEDARLAEPFWDTILASGNFTIIDEVHQLVGIGVTTGRTTDAVTEYPLERLEDGVDAAGNVNGGLIGMTTLEHLATMRARNSAFVARFEVVTMDETTDNDRERIITDLATERQQRTRRVYTPGAIDYYNNNYMAIDSSKHPNRAAKDNFDTLDMQIAAMIDTGEIQAVRDPDGNYIITEDHVEIAIRLYGEGRQAATFESRVAELRRILNELCTRYGFDARALGLGTPDDFARLRQRRSETDWAPALFRVNRVIGLLQTLEQQAAAAQNYDQLRVLLGQAQNQIRVQQGLAPPPPTPPVDEDGNPWHANPTSMRTGSPGAEDPRARAPQTAGEQWLDSLNPAVADELLRAFGDVRVIDDYLTRGFTPDHILALAPHMVRQNRLARALLSPFRAADGSMVALNPDVVLHLLNDRGFAQVLAQSGVDQRMIPTIAQIYLNPNPIQPGMYVLPDGRLIGPMNPGVLPPADLGAIPAANFRPRPTTPSPAFGTPNVDGEEVGDDEDTDSGAADRSGLVIRGPAEIQTELRGLLDTDPTSVESRRDILIYIQNHRNMDAQGLCGLMYRQTQLVAALATSQGLTLRNIESIQYAVIRATYRTIRQFEASTTPSSPEQLASAIQRNVQVALDGALSVPANASADLRARVDRYKSAVVTGSSSNLTSFPSLTTRQRSR